MQSKLWRLAASVIVVTGLTACSSLSGMTDKVSQTWDKTWTGLTGKKQVQTQTEVKQAGPAAVGLKPGEESGRWQGLYSLDGETARFQECESGQIIGVLPEGDSVLLEQAYLNTRSSATVSSTVPSDELRWPPFSRVTSIIFFLSSAHSFCSSASLSPYRPLKSPTDSKRLISIPP
ncbi:hypothetical protein SDC9_106675 [bioreactor metagenome]|uniref:NlpE C-terminal OB domain-containing protein n=1 Tax=bioreactor metagenome TaxID=1076179 RepID=A0A645B328_9ZZZZ